MAHDDIIPDDNVVRVIYQFVDHLNLGELGSSKVRHNGKVRDRWHGQLAKPLWHYDGVLNKKIKRRVSADVGLMLIAYNLRRLSNILKAEERLQPPTAPHCDKLGLIRLTGDLLKLILVILAPYRSSSLTFSQLAFLGSGRRERRGFLDKLPLASIKADISH